ncbi:MAG: hypothetical protein KA339_10380 [Candidatus Kapabacteria bacterium]|nr:hypothetical protein [Candidatus Kapabacteria bacterium]MBP7092716.1 hypothetical protein [Candidatus Kapabacteria bacterium]
MSSNNLRSTLLFLDPKKISVLLDRFRSGDADLQVPPVPALCLALERYVVHDLDGTLVLLQSLFDERRLGRTSPYSIATALLRAHVLLDAGSLGEALTVLDETMTSHPEADSEELIALHQKRGFVFLGLQRFSDAMSSFEIAHQLALEEQDEVMAAKIYANMAHASVATGDVVRSITMYEQCLLTFSTMPGSETSLITTRINLASLYQNVGRNEEALTVYDLLVEDPIVLSRPALNSAVLLNRSIALKRLERFSESALAYSAAHAFAVSTSNVDAQIRSLIGIAGLQKVLDELSLARTTALEALSIVLLNPGHPLTNEVQATLADIEWAEGSRSEAIARLHTVFDALIAIEDHHMAIIYAKDLVDWYVSEERWEEAYRVQFECDRIQKMVYEKEVERTIELTSFRSRLDNERETIRQRDEERTKILNAVVPQHIADRLMSGETRIADRITDVTILFVDVVGFTEMASTQTPEVLVQWLESLFTSLDGVFSRYGCERIKTIGDSYMAISGATSHSSDHTEHMVRAALEIVSGKADLPVDARKLRIGINSGPVIAGVMGGSRLSYDVWGDTVNVAARMEEHSHPGRILCTADVAQKLAMHQEFSLEKREPLDIRGKGLMTTYWVNSSR